MSISTRTGDDGCTNLPAENAGRVSKDDPRIECLGVLDELDAFLALCEVTADEQTNCKQIITTIRQTLFDTIMPAAMGQHDCPADHLAELEQRIAELEKAAPAGGFVRTWKTPAAAQLNAARTVCRRAERRMAGMIGAEKNARCFTQSPQTASRPLAWLNRLSDLLFLLAVKEN